MQTLTGYRYPFHYPLRILLHHSKLNHRFYRHASQRKTTYICGVVLNASNNYMRSHAQRNQHMWSHTPRNQHMRSHAQRNQHMRSHAPRNQHMRSHAQRNQHMQSHAPRNQHMRIFSTPTTYAYLLNANNICVSSQRKQRRGDLLSHPFFFSL